MGSNDLLGFGTLLTADVVAARLGVAVDTVYRLAHGRKLAFVRVASCMRFMPEHVDAFVTGNIVAPTS